MLTLLADAMFAATLSKNSKDFPANPQDYADHYIPKRRPNPDWHARTHTSYRELW